jgi:uncharacterized delta-60 repeat protein
MSRAIRSSVTAVIVAGVLIATVVVPASAASGDLDPSFGVGGRVTTVFPGGAAANAVAIQPDGLIVVVGWAARPGGVGAFAVARYEPNGSLDPTFGDGGTVLTPIRGGGDEARSVGLQRNGKIVVAGSDDRARFAVVRYLTDGSLDPSFGGNGIVRTDLTRGDDVAYDLAIQPDGRIVVVGSAGTWPPSFAVVRYRVDGRRDRAFGDRGVVITSLRWAVARAVTLQPDGRIVVAGYHSRGLALMRHLPRGRLDPTFGGDGRVGNVVPLISGHAVAIQADGRILAAGDWGIFAVGVARFTAAGRLDPTFGRDGVAHTRVGGGGSEQALSSVLLTPGGKIITAGGVGPHEPGDEVVSRFIALRWRRNGALDRTWGGNGKVQTRFPGGARGWGAALQADGAVVVVGGAGDGNAEAFALARYLP